MRLRSACCVKSTHDISDFSETISDFCTFGRSMLSDMEKRTKERMETLGEAASRLLAGMVRRAEDARPGVERAPRIALRLVAANDERRDRRGEECSTTPHASVAREDDDGIFVTDAD
jgi:hypothetical protein